MRNILSKIILISESDGKSCFHPRDDEVKVFGSSCDSPGPDEFKDGIQEEFGTVVLEFSHFVSDEETGVVGTSDDLGIRGIQDIMNVTVVLV